MKQAREKVMTTSWIILFRFSKRQRYVTSLFWTRIRLILSFLKRLQLWSIVVETSVAKHERTRVTDYKLEMSAESCLQWWERYLFQTEGEKLAFYNFDLRTFVNNASHHLISTLPPGKILLSTIFNGSSQSADWDHLGLS